MRGLKIAASGWIYTVDIERGQIPEAVSCAETVAVAGRHGIEMWLDAACSPDTNLVNAAAMTMLLNCSSMTPAEIPLITGDVVVLGIDGVGASVSLTEDQLHVLGSAVLASLAA